MFDWKERKPQKVKVWMMGDYYPRPYPSTPTEYTQLGQKGAYLWPGKCPSWRTGTHDTATSILSLSLADFLPTHFSQYLGWKKTLLGNCAWMPWQPKCLWGTTACPERDGNAPRETWEAYTIGSLHPQWRQANSPIRKIHATKASKRLAKCAALLLLILF